MKTKSYGVRMIDTGFMIDILSNGARSGEEMSCMEPTEQVSYVKKSIIDRVGKHWASGLKLSDAQQDNFRGLYISDAKEPKGLELTRFTLTYLGGRLNCLQEKLNGIPGEINPGLLEGMLMSGEGFSNVKGTLFAALGFPLDGHVKLMEPDDDSDLASAIRSRLYGTSFDEDPLKVIQAMEEGSEKEEARKDLLTIIDENNIFIKYIEGPLDRLWMESQDGLYLNELLFVIKTSGSDAIRAEHQELFENAMGSLDLSLVHHQNLKWQFDRHTRAYQSAYPDLYEMLEAGIKEPEIAESDSKDALTEQLDGVSSGILEIRREIDSIRAQQREVTERLLAVKRAIAIAKGKNPDTPESKIEPKHGPGLFARSERKAGASEDSSDSPAPAPAP